MLNIIGIHLMFITIRLFSFSKHVTLTLLKYMRLLKKANISHTSYLPLVWRSHSWIFNILSLQRPFNIYSEMTPQETVHAICNTKMHFPSNVSDEMNDILRQVKLLLLILAFCCINCALSTSSKHSLRILSIFLFQSAPICTSQKLLFIYSIFYLFFSAFYFA